MTSNLSHLLDAIGVGRPLPDGTTWTRRAFTDAIGKSPGILAASRTERRGDALPIALAWVSALDQGRVPDGWHVATDTRDLALRILAARTAARGETARLEQLGARLVEWGITTSGEALAVELLERCGLRLQAALEVQGWAGVLVVVREVLS